VVEFLDSPTENEYNIRLTIPGVYYFTVDVTDDLRYSYSDTVAVEVLDLAQLDALLQAKWNGMKTALMEGNIQVALDYHQEIFRDDYEAIYTHLGSDLSAKVQEMQDIHLIFVTYDRAKYSITRNQDIEGQIVPITYYIYLSKDRAGLWRIERY